MGLKSLKQCLAEARPQIFIGSPKAHLARLLFGWGRGSLQRLLHVGPATFLLGGRSLAALTKIDLESLRLLPTPVDALATCGNFVYQR